MESGGGGGGGGRNDAEMRRSVIKNTAHSQYYPLQTVSQWRKMATTYLFQPRTHMEDLVT